MKLLVCISSVPDTTAKIAFTDNNTAFDRSNVQFILNPTDEWYALVRAIEVKEQLGGSVTVVTVGTSEVDQFVRKALAIGADDAVRINADPSDAYFVAAQIAAFAKEEAYDIVLTGKETIDYNGFNVGGMLSELLDLPYVSMAMHMTIEGTTASISREIEGGIEKLKVDAPFLISCQKGIAEQRIPNMRGIMMSRKKPLKVVEPVTVEILTTVALFEEPPAKSDTKYVDPADMEELVRLLNEEAKVI